MPSTFFRPHIPAPIGFRLTVHLRMTSVSLCTIKPTFVSLCLPRPTSVSLCPRRLASLLLYPLMLPPVSVCIFKMGFGALYPADRLLNVLLRPLRPASVLCVFPGQLLCYCVLVGWLLSRSICSCILLGRPRSLYHFRTTSVPAAFHDCLCVTVSSQAGICVTASHKAKLRVTVSSQVSSSKDHCP